MLPLLLLLVPNRRGRVLSEGRQECGACVKGVHGAEDMGCVLPMCSPSELGPPRMQIFASAPFMKRANTSNKVWCYLGAKPRLN